VLVAWASLVWGAPPSQALWHLVRAQTTSLAYNQGIAFDPSRAAFFFDGVASTTSSGVYRTGARLRPAGANTTAIPTTVEGYNHAGDLSFDPRRSRLLLGLECYYPAAGGNTCHTGAVAVVNPVTLRMRYYVNLARRQIRKAMWAEIDPTGQWIWTSSARHLVAYRASDVNPRTARRQRARRAPGIVGVDLGRVLPSAGVTGATFLPGPDPQHPELLLSINLGNHFDVVALPTTLTRGGLPRLAGRRPRVIITVARSTANDEPEGLAATASASGALPLGGVLHWQMLPELTRSTLYSRILTFRP
jgi:hypothetical protein